MAILLMVILLSSEQQGERLRETRSDRDFLGLLEESLRGELGPSDQTPVTFVAAGGNADPGGQPAPRIKEDVHSESSDGIGKTGKGDRFNEAEGIQHGPAIVVPLFPIFLMNLILVAILWDTVRQALEVARIRSDKA